MVAIHAKILSEVSILPPAKNYLQTNELLKEPTPIEWVVCGSVLFVCQLESPLPMPGSPTTKDIAWRVNSP